MHRVNGDTGLCGRVGHRDVGQRHVLEVNIDEVHVGVLHRQVLCMQSTGRGTWEVHDGTSPGLSILVTVLDVTFNQRSYRILWEVETGFVHTVDAEVRHGEDRSLTASVGEDRPDVGERHVTHRVVTRVTVCR